MCDTLWKLANDIRSRTEITIDYYKMSRERVTRKLRPLSIMFTEYYFYLIAYKADDETNTPVYFRVYREMVTTYGYQELDKQKKAFDKFFRDIDKSIENNNIDEFYRSFDVIEGVFGINTQFKTFDEFDTFMNGNKALIF